MKPSLQDETNQINTDDTSSTTRTKSKQQPQPLNCPRCDSTNTKFCYYNNYSLTQPRHFCKACRRYWTKGGALRNVPVGGASRKTKKLKSSSSSSPPSSAPADDSPAFEFFARISPSIDFQLDFSLDHHHHHQNPITNYSFMGLNNFSPIIHHNNTLSSSIESLSSLNQDLHWKLQQQRLAMVFGDHHDHHHHHQVMQNIKDDQDHKFVQPILFQNLEAPKKDITCVINNNNYPRNESAAAEASTTTEWFFGNSSSSNINNAATAGGWNNSTNIGVQAWGDLHHFTAFP